MNVYEAVASRRAVRGFKDEPVSREVLERVLSAAARSPSGSQVRETVAEILSPSNGLILFCGMSIGYEDPAVSYIRTGRAPLVETVKFVGG